jgi:hypothetical protein
MPVDEQDAEVTHCLSSWRSALALQDVDIERNHAIKLVFAIHTSWETNPPDGFDYFEIGLDIDTVTVAGYGAAEVLHV